MSSIDKPSSGSKSKTLQSVFKESFEPANIFSLYVVRELEKKGQKLTSRQIDEIKKSIRNSSDELRITLDDGKDEITNLELNEDDFNQFIQDFPKKITEAVPSAIEAAAGVLVREWRKSSNDFAAFTHAARQSFESNLYANWRESINMFDVYIEIASEYGEDYIKRARRRKRKNNFYLIDSLVRLHARACLIGREIASLIRCGFADGAYARWRALHETTVVMFFLKQHGEETARAYLDHDVIQRAELLRKQIEFASRINEKLPPKKTQKRLFDEEKRLVEKYGKEFSKQYGWATRALRKEQGSSIIANFKEIEESAGLDHWRPYYKFASHAVHAESHSLYYRLALSHLDQDNLILANSSDFGFAEPATDALISLCQATVALLSTPKFTVDDLVACKAMEVFSRHIQKVFIKTQNNLLRY